MQKAIALLMVVGMSTTSLAFAATGDAPASTGATPPAMTAAPTAPAMTATAAVAPVPTSTVTVTPTAPVKPSLGTSAGEYKSVSCTSNPLFSVNSCNQCFDGGSVKVGERLTGLYDNWINAGSGMMIAYKDEQKKPNMVKVGTTTWTMSPTDETKIWKDPAELTWAPVGSGSRMNTILQPGQKVRFVEADLAAGYTLDKTDRKNGDVVGMLKFPVVAHMVDTTSGTEGAAITHYECATYTLSAPVVTPTQSGSTPKPPIKEVTQTKTGPETLILILAAFFISFGLMITLRKRS